MDAKAQEQIEMATRLQMKLLKRYEDLLDAGELSPTDAATLTRLLSQNGWSLDETKLPTGLRGKLTHKVDPSLLDNDDDHVVGKIA